MQAALPSDIPVFASFIAAHFKRYLSRIMPARLITLLLLLLCGCCRLYAQKTLVFAGTFNRYKNKEGIQVLQLDTKTGLLKPLYTLTGILNPSYLALSGNGLFLYACIETRTPGAGSIAAFGIDTASGALHLLNRRKSSGENPVYTTLTKDGRYLFGVNYTEAGIDVFPVEGDGRIGPLLQAVAYTEGSHATERQAGAHTHSLQLSPDQDHIFVPDLGSDIIRSYRFDPGAAQPIVLPTAVQVKAAPGSGPRHFTFHPGGKYAYCIEEISGWVSAYRYTGGRLKPLQHIAAHKDSFEDYNSADIHCSPDGRFLYVSNRGDENNIALFAIRPDGRLRRIGLQPTMGEHPRIFALDEKGHFLIVANQVSGNISVFRRDRHSGKLRHIPQEIPLGNVSCVQIKTYE